jgi:hypothetical protein
MPTHLPITQEGEGRIEIKAVYDGPSTGGTAGGAGDGA